LANLLKIESYQVPPLEQPIRLSDFTPGIFKKISSRKGIKKAIKNGLVTVNGKVRRTGDYINGGELIELHQNRTITNKPTIDIPLEVIYEDDYLAIVNKPPGIIVSGNKKWTLENALSPHLTQSTLDDALQRPEPIHRLDYPTSGALIIGKTASAVIALNKLFETREITKTYVAVTIGKMDTKGVIDFNIDDKQSLSYYTVLASVNSPKYGCFNLVELKPETGRRHQLRKHLSEIGNPILGDLLYGKEGFLLKGKGLYLHAYSLNFIHPLTMENINISIDLPKKYKKLFPE